MAWWQIHLHVVRRSRALDGAKRVIVVKRMWDAHTCKSDAQLRPTQPKTYQEWCQTPISYGTSLGTSATTAGKISSSMCVPVICITCTMELNDHKPAARAVGAAWARRRWEGRLRSMLHLTALTEEGGGQAPCTANWDPMKKWRLLGGGKCTDRDAGSLVNLSWYGYGARNPGGWCPLLA